MTLCFLSRKMGFLYENHETQIQAQKAWKLRSELLMKSGNDQGTLNFKSRKQSCVCSRSTVKYFKKYLVKIFLLENKSCQKT